MASAPGKNSVVEKLGLPLATLMGSTGFRTLLLRALTLASAEVTWLQAVQVNANGSLEGLQELRGQLDPKEFRRGKVVLLAQLLGLLVAFIGENLTLRIIRETWPKFSLPNLDSKKKAKK